MARCSADTLVRMAITLLIALVRCQCWCSSYDWLLFTCTVTSSLQKGALPTGIAVLTWQVFGSIFWGKGMQR